VAKTELDLKSLARLGAKARLHELEAERQAILKAFPGLRTPASKADAPVAEAKPKAKKTRRRNLSPETRKATSERMKKYWAEKRAGGK